MDNNDNGSFFKKALIASPLVVGAGFTVKNISQNSSIFSKPILEVPSTISSASTGIRDFASQYMNSNPLFFRMNNAEELLKLTREVLSNKNISNISGEELKESIFRIAKRIDPNDIARETLIKRFENLNTAEEIMKSM